MGEIAKAIAEFLRLNTRTAFALFAAGVSIWVLLYYGIISRDPADLALGYLASFGLFVWLGYTVQKAIRWNKLRLAKKAAAANKQTEEIRNDAKAEATRKATIENLRHLEDAEAETVFWMYHRTQYRVRASNNWYEFANLVNLNVLLVEDQK